MYKFLLECICAFKILHCLSDCFCKYFSLQITLQDLGLYKSKDEKVWKEVFFKIIFNACTLFPLSRHNNGGTYGIQVDSKRTHSVFSAQDYSGPKPR